MGKEGLRNAEYLKDEPEQYVKPNKRMQAPLIVQLGFAAHPSTVRGLGEALKDQDENVWLNAHPQKESKEFLKSELEKAKTDAREKYYRKKIESGEIDLEELNRLLDHIPLTLFAEARGLIQLIENPYMTAKNEPVAILGYSQGGPASIIAATLRPDLFPRRDDERSTLILIHPAGLTGKKESAPDAVSAAKTVDESRLTKLGETFKGLGRAGLLQARYFSSLVMAALTKGSMGKALTDGLGYIGSDVSRADEEAYDMANTDMVPFINFLSKDLRIVILYDEDDGTFPASLLEDRAQELENVELRKTSGKGHFGPIHDPEGTAREIVSILRKSKN